MDVRLKRVYDEPADEDGWRVLVDRLWPRGITKDQVDAWAKDVAPSPDLRRWFGHQEGRFDEFTDRYRQELESGPALEEFRQQVDGHDRVTLLYAAKDTEHNHAVVLRDVLLAE